MKSFLKSALGRIGLYEWASRCWIRIEPRLTRSVRAVTGKDRRLVAAYLAAHDRPKLHVGCGDNHLAGWLNTELCPRGGQIYLDATRAFPLPGDTFAFVYTEHMIEHVPFADARAMLGECFRILRPGGVLRIVTPNLSFLTTLLSETKTPAQAEYIDYSFDVYKIVGPAGSGAHVFNHFMRAWGHQFIYDERSLAGLVAEAGFENVTPCALSDSAHLELRDLAKLDRMPEGFLATESIVVEGQKPAR